MSTTIAFLTRYLFPEQTPGFVPGWDMFIQYAVARAVEARGYDTLAVNPYRPTFSPEHLVAQRPAGVLVTYDVGEASVGLQTMEALQRAHIPVVAYGDGKQLQSFDRVASDHAGGTELLTRWLLNCGRRQILRAWRVEGEHDWLTSRNRGFERAMANAGLPALPALRIAGYYKHPDTEERFREASRMTMAYLFEALQRNPQIDAIMAASDAHACEVIAALRMLGREPNRDILVVGYDAMWPHMPLREWESVGPVATIDKRNPESAAALVDRLLSRVAGAVPPEPQLNLIAPKLVVL